MKIKTYTLNDIDPKEMAKILYEATPEEFAEVWFEFSGLMEWNNIRDCGNKIKTQEIGKALGTVSGSRRLSILENLLDVARYHYLQERMEGK